MLEGRYLNDEQIAKAIGFQEKNIGELDRAIAKEATDHCLKVVVRYLDKHRLDRDNPNAFFFSMSDWQALKKLAGID